MSGRNSRLPAAVDLLAAEGYSLTVGLEVEFHVFARTDASLGHAQAGMPGTPPVTALLDQGYQYLADMNYDRLEPVIQHHVIEGLLKPAY